MRKAILHLKNSDPVLGALIERVGPYRIQFREPTFETLVRSITFQQLSGRVASVIFERLVSAMPRRKLTPKAILRLPVEELQKVGLSAQKAAYIVDLARQTHAKTVNFDQITALEDAEVIAHLTQVKGVGVWTAHMFLMFALRRPNILPTGDLGIRSAIRQLYALPNLPKPAEIEKIAERWHPYCSVASWYLWRALD
ncbi:MAG: DNA-3-methyladenine glycosylase family protein [Bryobacteraceae bacterium]